jgi:hypothetical protein
MVMKKLLLVLLIAACGDNIIPPTPVQPVPPADAATDASADAAVLTPDAGVDAGCGCHHGDDDDGCDGDR